MMCRLLLSLLSLLLAFTSVVSFSTLSGVSRGQSSARFAAPSASRQSEYGSVLELPETYVRCGRCQTIYAIQADDLGGGKGRRLECSVCSHSWFQAKDRLMDLRDGFEMVPLPTHDRDRIAANIEQGKSPKFVGDVKLYVGNIAFECHEDDILEVFSRAGDVGDVSLVRDDEGKNRGFGFVTMRTNEEGQKAIEELDGLSVRGRNIAVRASTN